MTNSDIKLALKNALRYIPQQYHEQLAPEFLDELLTYGRIYGYRFRPEGKIYGKPIDEYKGKCIEGKAFQVMIDNNLDFDVALYPYELVTYGETGQVFQNWMQYQLTKKYLEELTQDQTLVLHSGHPVGLFKSTPDAPVSYTHLNNEDATHDMTKYLIDKGHKDIALIMTSEADTILETERRRGYERALTCLLYTSRCV